MRLNRIDFLPATLDDLGPRDIMRAFPEPTLVDVAGVREAPLFVSVLLHGNETTGFYVLQHLARAYRDAPPPRSLMIFVGNVEATASGVRLLSGQRDFNRIWSAESELDVPEARLAREVTAIARDAGPFASIDVHNNTGANPYYGCVNALRPADLHLARRFAPVGVYYDNPPTTQSVAFSKFCPAVTLECGKSGDVGGVERAIALIERTMAAEEFPDAAPPAAALRLYRTLGRVVVSDAASFSFGEAATDLVLREDLEMLNFHDLSDGERIGEDRGDASALAVLDEAERDITARFFRREGRDIVLTRPVTPAMATRDHAVIRQDCLCYLMGPCDFDA